MSTSLTFDILARDRASDKFDKVGRSAGGATDKLKKFAKVGALAVAAGAVVAGKALFDMAKGAIEDEKAQGVLATSMKNAAGANKQQVKQIEAWITAQGKAKGIADDELRPALSRLVQATGDVGKAQKLTALAMDVSAGTGKSMTTVTEALQKAQNGSLGGLSRLGVATKDAEGKTKSLEQVTRDLANLHEGQAAKAAGTTEGKYKRLKVMFDETKETIGAKLIPVAEKLGTWLLDKGVPAVQKFGDWFKQKLMPPLREFAEKWAEQARGRMAALKDAFEDAKPFLELVGKIIMNVVVPGLKKLLDVVGPVMNASIRGLGKALEFVGKAGTWMWNNALQPAFKFLIKGIGVVADGFSAMLGAMGKVPGFGWAKDAAIAMGKAADKAYAVADGLKKIPPKKQVIVSVKYVYSGLKSPTRGGGGGGDEFGILPRGMVATAQTVATDLMAAIGRGIQDGGDKLDKILESSRDRIKTKLSQIRGDMASMSESIASALNPTDFGSGLTELMASLTGNNSALSGLSAVFEKLKGSVSKGFLSSLMQSGNATLATQLANDPAAAAQASALFDSNAAMAQGLGDQTAQAVLGDKIEKALEREIKKLIDELKDSPGKTARKLRDEIKELKLVVEGLSAGQKAHIRGAGGF